MWDTYLINFCGDAITWPPRSAASCSQPGFVTSFLVGVAACVMLRMDTTCRVEQLQKVYWRGHKQTGKQAHLCVWWGKRRLSRCQMTCPAVLWRTRIILMLTELMFVCMPKERGGRGGERDYFAFCTQRCESLLCVLWIYATCTHSRWAQWIASIGICLTICALLR